MKKYGKWTTFILIVIGAGILIAFLAGAYYLIGLSDRESDKSIQVYYIHNNPCESCGEYLHFMQEFQNQVRSEVPSSAYDIQELNLLKDSSKDTYDMLKESLDIPAQDRLTPMLIIGTHYLIGSENIEKNMKELLLSECGQTQTTPAVPAKGADRSSRSGMEIQQIPSATLNSDDSYILYFSTVACESCEKAASLIESLPDSFELARDGEMVFSKLVVEERNITEADNLALYQKLLSEFKVPEDKRVVPMIFYQNGYLGGEDAIRSGLETILVTGEALDFKTISVTASKAEGLTLGDIPKMVGAGLAGGLNPCSFSMLFLLLSLIAAKKDNELKLGTIYLISKLIAYSVIAVAFYRILNLLESSLLTSLQEIIRLILIVAALLFAMVNFIDFLKARREQYGKMFLKLPQKIRDADKNIMKRLINDSKKPLWITVFILGFFISVGEFLCTGQVYLATLLTMNYLDTEKGALSYFLIFIYILAMMLPSLGIVILVHRGKRLMLISDFILRHTDAIKLINMLVFLVIGLVLLFYRT